MHFFKTAVNGMMHKMSHIVKFGRNNNGAMAMNMAIYFSVFAIGAALLLPKFIESNIAGFLGNGQKVDRVITGSIKPRTNRHRIIKSVITPDGQRACLNLRSNDC